jgi:hypothetical protein
MWQAGLFILSMSFLQNISFTSVSRARNRNNLRYHLIAGIISNGIWFVTINALVTADLTWLLFIPYTIGAVSGSLTGAKISMVIERWLGATSDSHLKPRRLSASEQAQVWHDFTRLGTDDQKRQWIRDLQTSLESTAA